MPNNEISQINPTGVAGGEYKLKDSVSRGLFFESEDDYEEAVSQGLLNDLPDGTMIYTPSTGGGGGGGSSEAIDINYDNTDSSLDATNVQDAVDELKDGLDGKQSKLTNPLTKSDVVNNLTSTSTNVPLSAYQGKVLKDDLDKVLSFSTTGESITTTLYNCTGNLVQGAHIDRSLDGKHCRIYGRVRISNFVRKGNNPGITIKLPSDSSYYNAIAHEVIIGTNAIYPKEIAMIFKATNNTIHIVTSETINNISGDMLVLVIPMAIF